MAKARRKKKTGPKRKTGKKKRSGQLPLEVIAKFARKLKKNKRAADVYRSIL